MVDRRSFIAMLAAPVHVSANAAKPWRIGFLSDSGPTTPGEVGVESFFSLAIGLRELGYVAEATTAEAMFGPTAGG